MGWEKNMGMNYDRVKDLWGMFVVQGKGSIGATSYVVGSAPCMMIDQDSIEMTVGSMVVDPSLIKQQK